MSLKWQHLKDKGNDEFKKQNYTTAISLYTDSLSKKKHIFFNIKIFCLESFS
jgi:hypothetical protein